MLRIAHYNIFRGGEDRIKKVFKVIQEMNPDTIGILEAVDWHKKEKELKIYFKKKGYKYFTIGKANTRHNIAVVSKIPFNFKIFNENLRHVAVKVNLKIKIFSKVDLFFVHLSHVSEKERLKEIKQILKLSSKEEIIIMGDLNSLSDDDSYNNSKLFLKFKKRGIKKFGDKKLEFSVVKELKKNNLTDGMTYLKKSFEHSVPTLFNTDPDHNIPIRIDYVFLSKNLLKKLKNIEIFKNKKTEQASDHYPLFIDLGK